MCLIFIAVNTWLRCQWVLKEGTVYGQPALDRMAGLLSPSSSRSSITRAENRSEHRVRNQQKRKENMVTMIVRNLMMVRKAMMVRKVMMVSRVMMVRKEMMVMKVMMKRKVMMAKKVRKVMMIMMRKVMMA